VLDGATLRLDGLIALPDGSDLHCHQGEGPAEHPEELGEAIGLTLRAVAGPEFFKAMA
jgi:hypothetical protein